MAERENFDEIRVCCDDILTDNELRSMSANMKTRVCINDTLTDDELQAILAKLGSDKDKDIFGLVCKRWLHLQSTERKKLCARAGPLMLRKMAARFSRLNELDLSQSSSRSFYPGVTDSDLSVVAAGFGYLRILNLQLCQGVTDAGMVILANGLSSLQSLDISYCKRLTDKGLIAITEGCFNLKCLHLAGCKFITDALLQALSKNSPNLEELGLRGCIKITDLGLTDLAKGCHNIKLLDINKCSKIGDIGLSSVSKACSSLTLLKFSGCYKVGDDTISSLMIFCKNLETLDISSCQNISDEYIKLLPAAFKHSLKNLLMGSRSNVSNSSLNSIFSLCENLEALDIESCEEVTDMAFQGFDNGRFESGLKFLKVRNCLNITVSGIVMIVESCKSLEYLDVTWCPHVTKLGCAQAGLQFPEHCKVNFTANLSEPLVFQNKLL